MNAQATVRQTGATHRQSAIAGLLASTRPKQWTKNLLVFGPLVFAYKLFGPELEHAFIAFAAFCLASSAIYAVNDVLDLDNDRQHPSKSSRPLAAGQITVGQSILWAAFLALAGMGLAFAINLELGLAVGGYIALMLVYSTVLKHLVIIDVFAIAGGFMLRAVVGALAIPVQV